MTTQNELQHSSQGGSLGRRALQGASIAFALATVFLSVIFSFGGVLVGKNFWQGAFEFLPLVTVPIGGALGGMVYYVMVQVWYPGNWRKAVATVVSALVYIVLTWLSLVAGFSATGQWD